MPETVTVVYIDTLFLLNLTVNYLLLLATAKLCALPAKRWRLVLGAAFGGLYAVAAFMPGLIWVISLLAKVAVSFLIIVIAFGFSNRMLRAGLVFWAVGFAFGGCILAVNLLTGSQAGVIQNNVPYVNINARLLLLVTALFYALLTLIFKGVARRGRRDMSSVTVSLNDKNVSFNALQDSGNTLTDPISGAPVMIADTAHLLPLWPCEARSLLQNDTLADPASVLLALNALALPIKMRLIPYKAIGTDCGFLLAFKPDSVTVGGAAHRDLLVALSPTPISGGVYSAIIHIEA